MLGRALEVLTGSGLPRSQCRSSASPFSEITNTSCHSISPQEAMMQASRWPWILWSQAADLPVSLVSLQASLATQGQVSHGGMLGSAWKWTF